MASILEISDVDQIFRTGFLMKRVQILHGISLKVDRRAVFGFLGPNGAGKTTLIHLIAGVKRPAKGSVRIDGHEATSVRARMKVGYLPERPYFYDHLTGEGLLKYFGALSGMPRSHILDRIPAVLAAVGMSDARKLELKKYSKGMLQRIGIAQAILHDPEFLVLDEPMSGLDPTGRKEMRELILHLAAEGRTIFFSSHVIPDVEAICDQVGMIHRGRLAGCGPIAGFLAGGPVSTEVAFSGLPAEAARSLGALSAIREMPEGIRAVVANPEDVNGVVRSLLDRQARLLWVTPIRPSLEDLFESRLK